MVDPTADFFGALEQHGHEPLLERASGTVRTDVVDGERTEHWFVSIDKGDIAVSRSDGEADCVVRADRSVFDALVGGEANAMASVLRGTVAAQGNFELLWLFQRLFPGPPTPRDQPLPAGYARRQQ